MSIKWLRLVSTAVLASLVLATANCSSMNEPMAPEPAVPEPLVLGPDGSLLGTGLLACPAQPYLSVRQTIGPEGGTLLIGRHKLVVPRGALAAPVAIRAERPSDPVVSVRFFPEGLQFAAGKPAKLTLDYGHCPLALLNLNKRIAYTTDDLRILSYLRTLDELLRHRATGDVEHFSRYALAW